MAIGGRYSETDLESHYRISGKKRLFRPFAILFLLVGLISLFSPAQPIQAGIDPRFGIIESYESPTAALQAGVGWTRVRFQWAEVQADGPASWTPSVTDEQIDGEVAAGRLVVGMLIGIPDWARDENNLPKGLWLPYNDPNNSWARFVRNAVRRYRGRIDHWIIWNEPDIWDEAAPGHTWDGTEEDFLQLQRTAYLIARETNPNVVIHLAATTYFWDAQYGREQYLSRFFQLLTADPQAEINNYYFDVLSAHLYFQPNLIYDVIQEFDRIREENNIPKKPIWLVETNAPPINDDSWPVENWTLSVLLDEQAAFMPEALASALAAGAERIAIYKLRDVEEDRQANPEPFGLVRLDGTRRPAFTTYRIAVQYLSDFTEAERERWDSVGQIRVVQPGRTTTVLFARLPSEQQARVRATAERAVLVTMWGERREVIAEDGYFTVDLPSALCTQPIGDYCMIGGSAFYLVQSDSGGSAPPAPLLPGLATPTLAPDLPTLTPFPTTTPIPTRTTTPAPTLSWTATPDPTNIPTQTPTTIPSLTPLPTMTSTPAIVLSPTSPSANQSADSGPEPLNPILLAAVGIMFFIAVVLVGKIFLHRESG
ncbi:MAG: hypothetical protein WAM60_13345 [Candidatus Promineifilaceae bacterium]